MTEQQGYAGNWYIQPAGEPGTFAWAKQCVFDCTSWSARPEFNKRTTPGLRKIRWPTAHKRVSPFEIHGLDVTMPVTQTSYLYPLACFCNFQGYGTVGTASAGGVVPAYTMRFRPIPHRGTTVSSNYKWPKCLDAKVVYDLGTSDAYSPCLVERFGLRWDEDAQVEASVGLVAGSCYEGTVFNQAYGTELQEDKEAAFQARDGTVRLDGSVWDVQNGNLELMQSVYPHRGLNNGTNASSAAYGAEVTGRGALTIYLQTQEDWIPLHNFCRHGTFGTLTMQFIGSRSIDGTASLNSQLIGTLLIDPLTVTRPVSDDGELTTTLTWDLVGLSDDTVASVPFDFTGTFFWPFSASCVPPSD